MKVSVILCTYNRADDLRFALQSLAQQRMSEPWEVLVVDNNSSDQTRQVVQEFPFRYIFEPTPGKSHALNRGIQEAQGEILAFTDDDLTFDEWWLDRLTMPIRYGRCVGTSGQTRIAPTFKPPKWMALGGPYDLGSILGARFDLGDEEIKLSKAPYGANMAYRKEMFARHGGFRLDLGPSPDSSVPRPGEDTEFGNRLLKAGEELHYTPALAYHPAAYGRVCQEYFLKWHFDWGRALVREWGVRKNRKYLNVASIALRFLPKQLLGCVTLDHEKRFYYRCHVQTALGQIREFVKA